MEDFAVALERERLSRMSWGERLLWQLERRRAQATCPECGANVHKAGRDINRATYCSNACRQKAYRKRSVTAGNVQEAPSVTEDDR
jgi:hypothetical protein